MKEAQDAMNDGHCSLQLGVWGASSPPAGPGQSSGGGPGSKGGKLPQALEILQFTLAKKCQKYILVVLYTKLQFHEFC